MQLENLAKKSRPVDKHIRNWNIVPLYSPIHIPFTAMWFQQQMTDLLSIFNHLFTKGPDGILQAISNWQEAWMVMIYLMFGRCRSEEKLLIHGIILFVQTLSKQKPETWEEQRS